LATRIPGAGLFAGELFELCPCFWLLWRRMSIVGPLASDPLKHLIELGEAAGTTA
jgi:hypothetical protein